MKPKEDPKDKADRERQRRIADLDRTQTAQENARGLASDLRSVYDIRALSMFGMGGGPGRSPAPAKPKPTFGTGR